MNLSRILSITVALLASLVACLPATAEMTLEPGTSVTFYHHDLLGSPIMASDHKGRVLWYENSKPYGQSLGKTSASGLGHLDNTVNESTSNLGYTGHTVDSSTGLVYMKARHYDPVIGRFYSNDPVGFTASNPMMFNRYAYANNNPYLYTDPDGRYATDNYSEDDVEKYMSTDLQMAIETGVVGGDSVAVERLTYSVGKDHWNNGEGVDMLVTGSLTVLPLTPTYECQDDVGSTCQSGIVANPIDYAGSGQVEVKGVGISARIQPEKYDFDQKEVPSFIDSPGSHIWNRVRNFGTRRGEADHGQGSEFEVHYSAPARGWIQ